MLLNAGRLGIGVEEVRAVGQRVHPGGLPVGQDLVEVAHELLHLLVPLIGVLGQGPGQHIVDIRGDPGNDLRQRWRGGVADVKEHTRDVGGVKGQYAGQDLVGDGAQGEDVRAVVDGLDLSPGLLRRHVHGRANDRLVLGHHALAAANLGDAEVQDLDLDAEVGGVDQQDVLGLQIPVNDAPLVDHLQGAPHLLYELDHLVRRQLLHAIQPRLQVLPLQVLHHHVGLAAGQLVEVHHVDDVGVAQLRHDLGLPAEARVDHRVGHHLGVEDLHRDALAPQAHVLCLVDDAHPPLRDAAEDLVGIVKYLPYLDAIFCQECLVIYRK